MTKKTIKKKAVKKSSSPKKTTPKKKSTTKHEEPTLKIIQTAKCQTVSNKSSLTYNVGVDDKKDIFIRVYSNSGGGYFSNEWVSLNHITSILSDAPADNTITSINLIPLFTGKSVNTPGYLLAVLLKEGLLTPFEEGKKRQYVFSGADKFMAKLAKKAK